MLTLPKNTPKGTEKKILFIAVESLFGKANADDFNDVNLGFVKNLREKNCRVVLIHGKGADAQAKGVKAAHISYAEGYAENPLLSKGKENFSDLAHRFNAKPKNALFIVAGDEMVDAIKAERLDVCEAHVKYPCALVASAPVSFYKDSENAFKTIKQAAASFIMK